jgi:hypothetical protein
MRIRCTGNRGASFGRPLDPITQDSCAFYAEETKEFGRRLRKGAGADPAASGATRIAGTTNYKRKHEPDFPKVKIVDATPGRIVTQAELESLGLVALPEPAPRRNCTKISTEKPRIRRRTHLAGL